MPPPVAVGGGLLSSFGGLSGVGSLLSGMGALGSVFGGRGSRIAKDPVQNYWTARQQDFVENQYRQERHDRLNAITHAAQDARRAGLHPLFALGGGANFSPITSTQPGQPIPGQSVSGSHAGDALAGVGSALRSFAKTQKQRLSRYDEARTQEAEARAGIEQLTLMQMKEEYARTKLNPASIGQSGPVSSVEQLGPEMFENPPTKAHSLFIPVRLPNGEMSWGINPELEEWASWMPAAGQYVKSKVGDWFNKPRGKIRGGIQ